MSKQLAEKQIEWDLHENAEALIPLEFTEEIKPDLFGLELTKAQEMTSGLSATLAEREVLKNAYVDVIELPITTETLPIFKELRLKIVKNRTQGITKWKGKEKAFYLAGGNFIQAIYNKEVAVNEEMESKLLEAEKFFENQEKEKARLLNESRIEKIRPYVEDVTGLDFVAMTDEDFDDYLLGKKTRFENEQKEREAEAERKIEADKQAKIQAKIQAEKDAEIKKLNNEKVKAENERLEKEKTKKIEAEKLAKAPIKKQLSVWVNSFEIESTSIDNETSKQIKEKFEAFKKWSLLQVDGL